MTAAIIYGLFCVWFIGFWIAGIVLDLQFDQPLYWWRCFLWPIPVTKSFFKHIRHL